MQETISRNFQGSFNNEAKNKSSKNTGGVKTDPKFAQAHAKIQQISSIEANMLQLNI